MNMKNLLEEKREEIIRISERRGARNIRIFGSVARGEAGEDSDVDFLIRPDKGFTMLQHNALIRELRELLGCKVDVVSERGLRPRMRDRVTREAVPL